MLTAVSRATRPEPATSAKQVSESETVTDWRTVRRDVDPKDAYLRERTFKWMATLPASIRPMATARQYPRIANRIAGLWPKCEFTRLYLQSLLIDRRGGRKGFPGAIRHEIEVLQQYYFEHLSGLPAVLWNAVPLVEPHIPQKAFPPISHQAEIEIRAV